ncbi:MAG: hypothetical protein CBC35_04380 [Planctomycetes bacterium TMED75]|nr:hypothetical protein [Planctomycetaceae bacterium]OUU94211.1 MAG: hypothetical protein CBC35_04380 [Planctomycetes bacterium TMED75]
MNSMTLEIATECVEFASEAAVSVDRFEICCDLHQEGWTASGDLMSQFVDVVGGRAEVHALIRPRSPLASGRLDLSDFLAQGACLDQSMAHIDEAGSRGLQGVVIGPCTLDGRIDLSAARALCLQAGHHALEVGFHRAFDLLQNRRQALDELRALGIRRVLSSGSRGWNIQADTITDRVEVLRALSDHANHMDAVRSDPVIQVVGCGGVRSDNATVFLGATGHIHASCRRNGRPDASEVSKLREVIKLQQRSAVEGDSGLGDRESQS